jgi:hypothetical protein
VPIGHKRRAVGQRFGDDQRFVSRALQQPLADKVLRRAQNVQENFGAIHFTSNTEFNTKSSTLVSAKLEPLIAQWPSSVLFAPDDLWVNGR